MSPEGRLRLTYPLRLALAESPESLLEPETRLHHVEPVSLGGDLVEDARKAGRPRRERGRERPERARSHPNEGPL